MMAEWQSSGGSLTTSLAVSRDMLKILIWEVETPNFCGVVPALPSLAARCSLQGKKAA
jgi:hypothetical protein